MIRKECGNKIPKYLGCFVVLSMLPQVIGFNGSTIDTLFKFLLIGALIFLMINREHITMVSKYFCFFLIVSFIRTLGTIIWNEEGIFSETQSWIIEVLFINK